jgi:Porin PorA
VNLPEEALTLIQAAPDAAPRRRCVLPRSGGRIRPVLAGLGAFLMTFGLLLRFYAAPRLIAAPVGIYSTVTLADPHASYFDQGTLAARHNVTLTLTETVRGDAAASTGTIAVWDLFTALGDLKHNVQLNVVFQRSAFNRRTGELTNCCGASVNDDTRARQDGIVAVKWPIGTQKTTYRVYDLNTERAWPAVYSGTAHVQGLLTYRFTQRIPSTVVQQLPGVPTSLLGLPGASRTVVANRTFQASNTFWVDPLTGAPVDAEERILSVLHGPGGQGRLVVANADLKMTPASQRSLAALARQNAVTITTLRRTGPLGGLLLGILLILAATVPIPRLPWQARPNPTSRSRRSRRTAKLVV